MEKEKFKKGKLKDIEEFISLLNQTSKEVKNNFDNLIKKINKLKTKLEKLQSDNN